MSDLLSSDNERLGMDASPLVPTAPATPDVEERWNGPPGGRTLRRARAAELPLRMFSRPYATPKSKMFKAKRDRFKHCGVRGRGRATSADSERDESEGEPSFEYVNFGA